MTIAAGIQIGRCYWYSESGVHMIVKVVSVRIAGAANQEFHFTMQCLGATSRARASIPIGCLFTVMRTESGAYCPWHLRELAHLAKTFPAVAPAVTLWERP